jgi:glycosyltransferase involved in cell wall biosynthesis
MRSFYKNFYGLLDVYNAWDRRNDVSIVVVGQQWSNDEKRYIKNLDLSKRVHLMTEVDDETLCQLYNQALALVFPSIYEGFGLPLLEAMSCGCPVIASSIPSSIEVAGECPIYFDHLQPASLLNAFDKVFSEGRNSGRTKRGLEWVKRFSWDRTALQTLEVYRSMKNGN